LTSGTVAALQAAMQIQIMFPRFLTILAIVWCLGIGKANAQKAVTTAPAPPQMDLFELSIGFDYLYADDALAKNMYGGDISLFLNVNSWLAVGGEFIGEYGEKDHLVFNRNTTFDEDRLFYVFGARLNVWQNDTFKVFAEALGGGGHGHASALIFGVDRHASADGFAAVLGAGTEWKFNQRLAWRIIEADYIPAHFGGQWENDFRVATGLSFFFGKGW
jgi:hypothetical protein